MNVQPFNAQAKNILVTVPNGSASAAQALPAIGSVIQLKNTGSGLSYFAIGNSSVAAQVPGSTATTNSMPILPGETNCYSIPSDQIYYISAWGSAASTLVVSVGEGQ